MRFTTARPGARSRIASPSAARASLTSTFGTHSSSSGRALRACAAGAAWGWQVARQIKRKAPSAGFWPSAPGGVNENARALGLARSRYVARVPSALRPACRSARGGRSTSRVRPPGSRSLTNRALADRRARVGRERPPRRDRERRHRRDARGAPRARRADRRGGRRLDGRGLRAGASRRAARVALDVRASGTTARFLTAAADARGAGRRGHARRHAAHARAPDRRPRRGAQRARRRRRGARPRAAARRCACAAAASRAAASRSTRAARASTCRACCSPRPAPRATSSSRSSRAALVSRPFVDLTLQVMGEFGADARWTRDGRARACARAGRYRRATLRDRARRPGRRLRLRRRRDRAAAACVVEGIPAGSRQPDLRAPRRPRSDGLPRAARGGRDRARRARRAASAACACDGERHARRRARARRGRALRGRPDRDPQRRATCASRRPTASPRSRREIRRLGGARRSGPRLAPHRAGELSARRVIETYDDHRMAMSFALAGLARARRRDPRPRLRGARPGPTSSPRSIPGERNREPARRVKVESAAVRGEAPLTENARRGVRVEADALTRRFGDHLALDGVSLAIAPGEAFGLLGANGAGKTTFIRCLTGTLLPSGGELSRGRPLADERPAARCERGSASWRRPRASIRSSACGASSASRPARAGSPGARATRRSRASSSASRSARSRQRLVGHLSKGFQQRVSLAQAFVSDPPLVIVDEPTGGLDPVQQRRGAAACCARSAGERTLLLCTHDLDEARALSRARGGARTAGGWSRSARPARSSRAIRSRCSARRPRA